MADVEQGELRLGRKTEIPVILVARVELLRTMAGPGYYDPIAVGMKALPHHSLPRAAWGDYFDTVRANAVLQRKFAGKGINRPEEALRPLIWPVRGREP
ncbi:MAG: hypothetical protein ACJ74Q_15730 [Pyrinomonadaceae bacterium]